MKVFRLHLSTALLLMAVIAVWLGYWTAIRDAAQQRAELPTLQLLAGELHVTDPTAITAVRRRAEWYGEKKWDVFLPSGVSYRICLAMDNIEKDELPIAEATAQLTDGKNRIEICYDKFDEQVVAQILVNDAPVIEAARPKTWDNSNGYGMTSTVGACETFPPEGPLKLLEMRLSIPGPNGGGSINKKENKGVVVWIESVPFDAKPIPATPNL